MTEPKFKKGQKVYCCEEFDEVTIITPVTISDIFIVGIPDEDEEYQYELSYENGALLDDHIPESCLCADLEEANYVLLKKLEQKMECLQYVCDIVRKRLKKERICSLEQKKEK